MSVDDPVPPDDKLTLAGFRAADSPEEGDTEVDRDTVPAKLSRLDRLIVDEPELPVDIERLDGLVEREKSPMPTVTTVVCENEPLVAVIVTE